jgi:hypothetical protein
MTSTKENLISKYLEVEKTTPIGSGEHCNVYHYSNTKVLKVVQYQCSGQLTFIEFCNQQKTNKEHLPKIYDVKVIGRKTYILMERLEEVQDDMYIIQEQAESVGWFERDTELWRGLSDSLDKLLDDMEYWFGDITEKRDTHLHDWDLHAGNIMVRPSDKKLVIVDPWA